MEAKKKGLDNGVYILPHFILITTCAEYFRKPRLTFENTQFLSLSKDGTRVGRGRFKGGSITMNKAGGGDGIPAELFQILKDDAVKVLHSVCQQIWKTQQWLQDWKSSVFIPVPKKVNAKECSNYSTIALISHNSKVMLKNYPR